MRSAPDEGLICGYRIARLHSRTVPLRPLVHLPTRGRGEENAYVAAVVTPPSTTMVWPVMKVEASEAR